MAKQGATKNRGKRKSKSERKRAKAKDDLDAVGIDGDLRAVAAHLKAYHNGQSEEATIALMGMGRDASFLVREAAESSDDPELTELAKKLAAVPPQVDTNLYGLRRASVQDRVNEALEDAPLAIEAENLMATGGAIAFFDPMRVQDDLAKSGRPRRDPERAQVGDLAWVGLPTAGGTPVQLHADPPPEGQQTRRLRLKVQSGVVFVGPPEASDGPRLGTVRLDPFHTELDAHMMRGAFVRLKPGIYAVHAYLSDSALEVHLIPDPAPTAEIAVDPASLGDVPRA